MYEENDSVHTWPHKYICTYVLTYIHMYGVKLKLIVCAFENDLNCFKNKRATKFLIFDAEVVVTQIVPSVQFFKFFLKPLFEQKIWKNYCAHVSWISMHEKRAQWCFYLRWFHWEKLSHGVSMYVCMYVCMYMYVSMYPSNRRKWGRTKCGLISWCDDTSPCLGST
jgi:hypothetical protein